MHDGAYFFVMVVDVIGAGNAFLRHQGRVRSHTIKNTEFGRLFDLVNIGSVNKEFHKQGGSILKENGEKSYRSAQLSTLAAFLPWGSSKGAGRMTLTVGKGKSIHPNLDFETNV